MMRCIRFKHTSKCIVLNYQQNMKKKSNNYIPNLFTVCLYVAGLTMMYFGNVVQLFTPLYPWFMRHKTFIYTLLFEDQFHIEATGSSRGDLMDHWRVR